MSRLPPLEALAKKEEWAIAEMTKIRKSITFERSILKDLARKAPNILVGSTLLHSLYGSQGQVKIYVKDLMDVVKLVDQFPPVPKCKFANGCTYIMPTFIADSSEEFLKNKPLPKDFIEFSGIHMELSTAETAIEWWSPMRGMLIRIEVAVKSQYSGESDVNLKENLPQLHQLYEMVRQVKVPDGESISGSVPSAKQAFFIAYAGYGPKVAGNKKWLFCTIEDFVDYAHNLWCAV